MCTLTVIPLGTLDFVLTTNRDEAPNRATLKPDFYTLNNTRLLFPKDVLSGGTWIGLSEKKRVVCLLNGGFVKHERKPSYRKSRGVVVNDFMLAEHLNETVETYNFVDIEPFTIVIIDWNMGLEFFELVWDGTEKHFKALPLESAIWSSSSLYSEAMKEKREQWFKDFKNEKDLEAESILKFHKTAGKNNKDFGVIMNRGFVKTTSITQIEKSGNKVKMWYKSLLDNRKTTQIFYMS